MAQLIPSIPPSDLPDSERRFFQKLTREPGTSEWVVFHSVGLSSRYTGHFGEIDFVILIPDRGIVCVEVKGGSVKQTNGVWVTKGRNGNTHELRRSPFAQVQSAMFKLRRAIEGRFGKTSVEARVPFGWMVAFPDVPSPPVTSEFGRGDVLDRDDFDRAIADRISDCPTLASARSHRDAARFSQSSFERIRSFLRPDFERVATAAASLKPIEEQIRALTEEQYAFLDAIDFNERCILVGPAGSGKTTLALEYTRRLASHGRSVLLACFNRLLGDWLSLATNSFGPGKVVAGSLHRILSERIDRTSFAQEFRRQRDHEDLFSELYPLFGAMAIDELGERFDAVLIDEAQDFRSEALVALAETWTRGIEGARISLFGDYTRQSLYGTPEESLEIARMQLGGAVVIPLKKNCRNTRRIAVHTSHLSSFRDFQLSHDQPDGDAVECFFYDTVDAQAQRLAELLLALKSDGVPPSDIVILGRYRLDNSVVGFSSLRFPWKIAAASDEGIPANTVAYSTIHAFKGMEAPIVIMVDVDNLSGGEGESLLYVGMSRARVRLYMLIAAECRAEFDRKVSEGLKELIGA